MGAGVIVVVTVIAVLVALLFGRHRERARRAALLRRVGFGVTAVFAVFLGLFIIGETISDPGGWAAVGMIASWAVPLAGLGFVAWYRADRAGPFFAILVGVVVAASLWFAIDPAGWRSFEDRRGPIRAVVVFVLAAAVALWGLRRTLLAGVLLLTLGLVPLALAGHGLGGASSLAAASSAPVITGVLYLASAAVAGGGAKGARVTQDRGAKAA